MTNCIYFKTKNVHIEDIIDLNENKIFSDLKDDIGNLIIVISGKYPHCKYSYIFNGEFYKEIAKVKNRPHYKMLELLDRIA